MNEKTARVISERYKGSTRVFHGDYEIGEADGYLAGLEAERERCYKIAFKMTCPGHPANDGYENGWAKAAEIISEQIKATYTSSQNDGKGDNNE